MEIPQNMFPAILEEARLPESWQDFYTDRSEANHLSSAEDAALQDFIQRRAYLSLCDAWEEGAFPCTLPKKHTINKEGTRKKRVVYSFEGDEGIFLKYIAWQLFRFDDYFCPNCYAFRRSIGVKDAVYRIRRNGQIGSRYCLKADISNYFNSIDIEILLTKLSFVQERDPSLYALFCRILREDRVVENGHVIRELHGAMAGTPISPFFANVYLRDVDFYFCDMNVMYFRYSDDILLFADSMEELLKYRDILYGQIHALGLEWNPDKVRITAPGDTWEFLGFCYRDGEIDLSANTLRKTKAKIRRKAEALRRWQRKKGLSPDKAAIGLIHTMNRKFYGSADGMCTDGNGKGGLGMGGKGRLGMGGSRGGEAHTHDFTWSRWFFPCLTTDKGLRELDAYMQQYIRYAVTGRHYKGNFRIRYETMKKWGYQSLVHAYYQSRGNSVSPDGDQTHRMNNADKENRTAPPCSQH